MSLNIHSDGVLQVKIKVQGIRATCLGRETHGALQYIYMQMMQFCLQNVNSSCKRWRVNLTGCVKRKTESKCREK